MADTRAWNHFPETALYHQSDLEADNRTHLAEVLVKNAVTASLAIGLPISARPLLSLQAECGTRQVFQTSEDLPEESLRCPCGCSWLIRYREPRPCP